MGQVFRTGLSVGKIAYVPRVIKRASRQAAVIQHISNCVETFLQQLRARIWMIATSLQSFRA